MLRHQERGLLELGVRGWVREVLDRYCLCGTLVCHGLYRVGGCGTVLVLSRSAWYCTWCCVVLCSAMLCTAWYFSPPGLGTKSERARGTAGFSCVSLTQLYSVCSANHRCADCLKQVQLYPRSPYYSTPKQPTHARVPRTTLLRNGARTHAFPVQLYRDLRAMGLPCPLLRCAAPYKSTPDALRTCYTSCYTLLSSALLHYALLATYFLLRASCYLLLRASCYARCGAEGERRTGGLRVVRRAQHRL